MIYSSLLDIENDLYINITDIISSTLCLTLNLIGNLYSATSIHHWSICQYCGRASCFYSDNSGAWIFIITFKVGSNWQFLLYF